MNDVALCMTNRKRGENKKNEEEKSVTYASKRCHVTEALLYTCSLVC